MWSGPSSFEHLQVFGIGGGIVGGNAGGGGQISGRGRPSRGQLGGGGKGGVDGDEGARGRAVNGDGHGEERTWRRAALLARLGIPLLLEGRAHEALEYLATAVRGAVHHEVEA